MSKKSVVMSVSMPIELAEFLNISELSPSTLLQERIKQEKQLWERYNDEKTKLIVRNENLVKQIKELFAFIDTKELFDEYRKWRGSYVLQQETKP